MASRLRLRHRLSSSTPTLPSSYSKANTRTHHLSFKKPTLDLPRNICTYERSKLCGKTGVTCRLIPESQIQSSNGGNDESGGGTQRMAVGATVLACCLLGMMSLNPMVCPSAVAAEGQRVIVTIGGGGERKGRRIERSLSSRSVSLATVRSGKLAMERLLDSKRANLNPYSLDAAEADFRRLLQQERPSILELQKVASKLEMSGKEDEAVAMLNAALKDKGQHEIYELEMILVEMLIYQGKYEHAKEILQKLKLEAPPSDARFPLYMAVINIMLGEGKEAMDSWQDFIRQRDELIVDEKDLPPPSYSNFVSTILLLKQEIDAARIS